MRYWNMKFCWISFSWIWEQSCKDLIIDADCELTNFDINKIIDSKDCILLLMSYLYCKKRSWRGGVEMLKNHAKKIIIDNEMDQYWLFVYEILGYGSLNDDWVPMKKSKVSFLKNEYR